MAHERVVLINAFEVPEGEDEAFLADWERARDVLRKQQGYISTQLHRSLSPSADFRFVNVAVWESPQAFQAAIAQPEFREAAPRHTSHPSLYEVVREDKPAT